VVGRRPPSWRDAVFADDLGFARVVAELIIALLGRIDVWSERTPGVELERRIGVVA
jgi:hypothetical protein